MRVMRTKRGNTDGGLRVLLIGRPAEALTTWLDRARSSVSGNRLLGPDGLSRDQRACSQRHRQESLPTGRARPSIVQRPWVALRLSDL